MTTKTQDQAQQLLNHLNNKTVPTDGLFYAKALYAIDLDYSDSSLAQLDALLTQLKRHGETPNSLIDHVGGENFIFMFAVYLIEFIARRTGKTAQWYNYHEAVNKLPTDFGLPQDFVSSIVAMIQGNVCLPLIILADVLHGRSTKTCLSYVEDRCQAIGTEKGPNEWCKQYLEAFRKKEYIPGGNAYRAALELIEFDDSLRSIEEIDRLMLTIKHTEQLSVDNYAVFITNTEKTNALLLIGFYMGMLVAKHTHNIVKWFGFEEYKQFTGQPDLAYQFEYHCVCMIGDKLLRPLSALTDTLFSPSDEDYSCLNFVTWGHQNLPQGHLAYFPSNTPQTYSEEPLAEDIKKAMSFAGFLAAMATFHVQDGSTHQPTKMIVHDGKATLVTLMSDDPVSMGLKELEENLGNHPYQSFAYDMYANLPTGRIDAFAIEVRGYGKDAYQLSLIVPYQKKDKDHDFQIHSVVMNMATLPFPPSKMQAVIEVFYEGAFGFISPYTKKSLWNECFVDVTIPMLDTQAAIPEFLDAQEKRFIDALTPVKPNTDQETTQTTETETHQKEIENAYRNMISDLNVAELVAQLPLKYRSYLQVVPPAWMKDDELYSQITAMPTLYRTGKVVWAALIQANKLMFQPEGASCPGEIIFDPTGQASVDTLLTSARQLFALKDTLPEQSDQLKYAQHLTDEMTRLVNYPFPQSLAPLPLRMSSVWFWRMHLPDGMLSMSYFPIIISEQCPGEAIVLPSLFWPQIFKDIWKEESKTKNNGQWIDLEASVFRRLEEGTQDLPKSLLEPKLSLIFSVDTATVDLTKKPLTVSENSSRILNNKHQGEALYEQAKQILDNPDTPVIEKKCALEPLLEAARLGNTDALTQLAHCYGEGVLVEKNEKTSHDYLLKLAHRGDVNACMAVAMYYWTGKSGDINLHEAHHWVSIAAQKGHEDAIQMLPRFDQLIADADMAVLEAEVKKSTSSLMPTTGLEWGIFAVVIILILLIFF